MHQKFNTFAKFIEEKIINNWCNVDIYCFDKILGLTTVIYVDKRSVTFIWQYVGCMTIHHADGNLQDSCLNLANYGKFKVIIVKSYVVHLVECSKISYREKKHCPLIAKWITSILELHRAQVMKHTNEGRERCTPWL